MDVGSRTPVTELIDDRWPTTATISWMRYLDGQEIDARGASRERHPRRPPSICQDRSRLLVALRSRTRESRGFWTASWTTFPRRPTCPRCEGSRDGR